MKSLSSVSPSVRPSPGFLKIGSLVFSDIVYDDSWAWYLVTEEARFFRKKFRHPMLDPMGLNQAQNEFFWHFLELDSLVFF